ncbi:uncharacterized protein [Magallana gigas]|uniref:uncharacterized protein n=1 Tax=Magallana gigas TaxID=29159 RepID=UPI003342DE81
MDNTAVTTQQPSPAGGQTPPKQLHSNGSVSVRNATESTEDREFLGRVVIDGFEGKYIHATNRESLPAMQTMFANHMRGRPPLFYERHFIAEYNGEKAGAIVLRYHGDSELFPGREEDLPPVGCCNTCGIILLEMAVPTDTPPGKCLIDMICVDTKFRGKGIGKVLLDMADMDAKKRGCKEIFLWVSSTNRAKHLYERQGYTYKNKRTLCCCGMWCGTGEREIVRMEKVLE